jgi:amino acid transporter
MTVLRSGTMEGADMADRQQTQPMFVEGQRTELKEGAIGLGGAMVIALSFMAPIMCLIFVTPGMASMVGAPVPLVFLIATIAILCTGNALVQFSRRFPSAGSSVTFISKGINGYVGLVAACLILVGMSVCPASVITIFGGWCSDTIARQAGVDIPWQILSAIGGAFFTYLAIRGLNLNAKVAGALFVFQCIVLVIISTAIFYAGGKEGLDAGAFNYSEMTSLSGMGWAFILAVYSYIGFESAAALGEETSDPRRNVPIAMFGSIIILGIIYMIVTYAAIVGYGTGHMDVLVNDESVFDTLLNSYLGGRGTLVFGLAGAASIAASAIAIFNTMPRIFYSTARAGGFPSAMARVHKTWKTPYVAILLYGTIVTLLPQIGALFTTDVQTLFNLFSTYGGVPVSIIYMTVNVALIAWWFRNGRDGHWLWMLLVPLAGIAIWIAPIYLNLKPAPEGIFKWTWTVTAVGLLLGLVFLWRMIRSGRDVSLLAQTVSGEADFEEVEEAAALPAAAMVTEEE